MNNDLIPFLENNDGKSSKKRLDKSTNNKSRVNRNSDLKHLTSSLSDPKFVVNNHNSKGNKLRSNFY